MLKFIQFCNYSIICLKSSNISSRAACSMKISNAVNLPLPFCLCLSPLTPTPSFTALTSTVVQLTSTQV